MSAIFEQANIPEEIIVQLQFLHDQSSKVRGTTPLLDPTRQAADDFCKLALRVVDEYDVTLTSLSLGLGLSHATVRLKLGRHGYAPLPPSQRVYQGVVLKGPRKKKTHCKRGHALEGENLKIETGGARRCITCRRERDRRLYAEGKR